MKKNLKILIISDSIQRELPALILLKKRLETVANAKVFIIGSLAENQRIFYMIYKIKPDITIISQVWEEVTRDIAGYIKKSGGIVCVVPAEITYSKAKSFWMFNKRLFYDEHVDFYFLSGYKMYEDIKKYTDISPKKLFVVGSPKIDIHVAKDYELVSRENFCKLFSIPKDSINIFIFTTFFSTPQDYIKKNVAFKGNIRETLSLGKIVRETKIKYINSLHKLCAYYPNLNFVLKPHPLEKFEMYKNIKEKNFFLITNRQFLDTVKSIDLAIHWTSTVSTECWIHGIKTIQYSPIKIYKKFLSDFHKGNPVYYDFESLVKGISKYLDKPMERKYLNFQKKYLSDWYYKVDGKSGERIAQILSKETSIKNIRVNYNKKYSFLYPILDFSEKILGIYLTRKIIKIFRKDYNADYAINNYIYISS